MKMKKKIQNLGEKLQIFTVPLIKRITVSFFLTHPKSTCNLYSIELINLKQSDEFMKEYADKSFERVSIDKRLI